MKPNELTIGDWARLSYDEYLTGNHVSFEFRVTVITHQHHKDLYVWGESPDGKHHGNMSNVERIQPVELTEEILEKNFGPMVDGQFFDGDEFHDMFIREINDGTWLLRCEHIEFAGMPHEQVMVSFVHELQHFLSHCAIEKEVVL